MERKFILGTTNENTIVFATVRYENHFSVCFDEVEPFIFNDEDAREYAESRLDDTDDGEKYRLCEEFDCKPCSLLDEYYTRVMNDYGVCGIYDVSLFPDNYTINDEEVYFKSDSCGQHDTREYLKPIDKKFSDFIFSMWDKYHLKEVAEKELNDIFTRINIYISSFDEEKFIINSCKEMLF